MRTLSEPIGLLKKLGVLTYATLQLAELKPLLTVLYSVGTPPAAYKRWDNGVLIFVIGFSPQVIVIAVTGAVSGTLAATRSSQSPVFRISMAGILVLMLAREPALSLRYNAYRLGGRYRLPRTAEP